jgi:DNA repair protein RadA/Sms
MRLGDMDVYVNVVGGVRVLEPALDLGIALAVISSLHDVPVPADACVFGEVGLAGEVRAVGHAERRATEASRLGFGQCVLPRASAAKMNSSKEFRLHAAATLHDAVEALLPQALQGGKRRSSGRDRKDGGEKSNSGEFTPTPLNGKRFASVESDNEADWAEEYEGN